METPSPHAAVAGPSDEADGPTRDRFGAPPAVPELELQLAMRSLMASMLGRVRDLELGRYRVRERIGQGGCGCGLVLLADDPQLVQEIARRIDLAAHRDVDDVDPRRGDPRHVVAEGRIAHRRRQERHLEPAPGDQTGAQLADVATRPADRAFHDLRDADHVAAPSLLPSGPRK